MVSYPVSEYPVNRFNAHHYVRRRRRSLYVTAWVALFIAASLLDAKSTVATSGGHPLTPTKLFQTVDDDSSLSADRDDTEHRDALNNLYAGSDRVLSRSDGLDAASLSNTVDESMDVPDTIDSMPAERGRRSAEHSSPDDREEVWPERESRVRRRSNDPTWMKSSSFSSDGAVGGDDEDDDGVGQLLVSPDASAKRPGSVNYGFRNRRLSGNVPMKTSPRGGGGGHRFVTRVGPSEHSSSFTKTTSNRQRGKSPNWISTEEDDVLIDDWRAADVEEERRLNNEVERQLLEKRTTSGRHSVFGELSRKRIAGKEPGSWNGSQKGWVSNNVRVWG